MTTYVLIAVLSTTAAFLLAAADTAIVRMSRHRAEQVADEGRRGSRALVQIVGESAPYLAVATFVRVVAEAVTAVMVTVAVDSVVDNLWQTALIAVGVMALISFVLTGVSPRTVGRQHGERIALLAAPTIRGLRIVLGPLAKALIMIANAVTPGRGYTEGPFASEAELRDLVDLAGESALIEAGEREMIHSIFELGDTVAREVMVPRPDMVSIRSDKGLRQAMSLFLRSGFSRVPVIGEDADDVVGLLYLKDVARALNANPDDATRSVTEVMRTVSRVPESKPADVLLRDMQAERQHFAVVIDEYGGTAGLVTIEDILEEIVGEITDEYDRDQPDDVEHLADGRMRLPAAMGVDEFAELLDLEIEEEDVDTLGGLLAKLIGRVPIVGATARIEDVEITAERMAGRRRRVSTVLVSRVPEPGAAADPDGDSGTEAQPGATPVSAEELRDAAAGSRSTEPERSP